MTDDKMPEKTNNNPPNVFELHEMIRELALAHDQQQAEIQELKSLLATHQHGKGGAALFPFNS
jgi:transcriptional regulator of acetoin/glycerol metabolism